MLLGIFDLRKFFVFSVSPFHKFGKLILNVVPLTEIQIMDYNKESWGQNDLGFYHVPGRNWKEVKKTN